MSAWTWPNIHQALSAIKARESGEFDNSDLKRIGALSTIDADVLRIKRLALEAYDFTVGPRDRRVNTDYPDGIYMVVECLNEQKLPFANPQDGSGDWAVVGDDLDWLIQKSFDALIEMCEL